MTLTVSAPAEAAWLLGRFAARLTPPADQTLSAWAEATLVIPGETGSERTGPLRWEGFEYLTEPLNRFHPDDPCRQVTVCGSAQVGKTMVGVVVTLYYSTEAPAAWCVALPSTDEVRKYNTEKWSPLVDASPAVRRRIAAVSSRDGEGSTGTFKRFAGGKGRFVHASSGNALQMVTFKILVLEETPQFEDDVDGRGAPIPQLTKRQLRFELAGAKTLHTATPGTEGRCPVSADFLAGDQRRLYHPCPHCGHLLRWDWEQFQALDTARPYFVCPACEGRTEHRHKLEGVARAVWVPTFPSTRPDNPAPDWHFAAEELPRWQARDLEGRQPSYHLWQVVSSGVDWAWIAREWDAAQKGGNAARVTFDQQVLGQATKVSVETADLDALVACAEPQARGVVPEGAYLLCGAVDLNGDFAAWAVWAFGPGLESWLVDTGVLEGGPSDPQLWRELSQLVSRTWPHAEGGDVPVQAWGVDSGYGTANVYAFCSNYAHVKALDGQDGWGRAPLKRGAKPSRVQGPDGTVCAARVWSVGTWDLKRTLFEALGVTRTVGAVGRAALKLHVPDWCCPAGTDGRPSKTWLEQLTAETLLERVDAKTGVVREAKWVRVRRRNEALDLWVYAAALAKSLGVGVPGSEPDWVELRRRVTTTRQHDLAELWGRPGGRLAPQAPEPPDPVSPPSQTGSGASDLAALYAAANQAD